MSEKNQLAIEVAKNLLKIKAVFLKPNDPFTWASGIKSPIYCDNRLTLSYPETRKVVENGLADMKNSDRRIVFCLYAKEGESVLFLDGGATLEAVTGISYQEILNRTEK